MRVDAAVFVPTGNPAASVASSGSPEELVPPGMRLDAEEFVPAGTIVPAAGPAAAAAAPEAEGATAGRAEERLPAPSLSADAPEFVLSASSAPFVPGAGGGAAEGKEPDAAAARLPPGGLSADAPEFSPPTGGAAEIAAGAGRYSTSDAYSGYDKGDGIALTGPPVFEFMDEEQFFTPTLMEPDYTGSSGKVRVEGRRLSWELAGPWEELRHLPQGESLASPWFNVAGVPLQLEFFPSGTKLAAEGASSVALMCEDKAKLKFEVFLNERSSGSKVMLGKKFSCDFRHPSPGPTGKTVVGIQVHENLLYAGFA